LRKAKENADDLLKEKIELQKEEKALSESAAEKDALLKVKVKSIGNIVHNSVPVSKNEVRLRYIYSHDTPLTHYY
jgi:seryl-tRNA synthetase